MGVELVLAFCCQDLFEREAALRRRLAPAVELGEPPALPAVIPEGLLQGPGAFDLKRNFKALFSKNVREEWLDGLRSSLQAELAASPLVIACYASPTVCDAIKHYRSTAGSMLGMELDGVRALEQSVGGVERELKARAVQECMDLQARLGASVDEAREACQGARLFRGLDGRPTSRIDVKRELKLGGSLVGELHLGAGRLSAEESGSAVMERFEALRRSRLDRWRDAFADPGRGAGAGPVAREELEQLAALDPSRREAAARSIAAAQALADLVAEAHDAERRLEAAELNATPEVRVELERRRDHLRHEVGRIRERFEAERRVSAAVAEAQAAAAEAVARAARSRLAPRRAGEAHPPEDERFKPWGCEVKRDERRSR
jgi:hypothetical protein